MISTSKTFNLNKTLKYFATLLIVAALASIMVLSSRLSVEAAGSAAINFSPSSGTYSKDESFTVDVRVATGSEAASTVKVVATYDNSKLQLTGITDASEPYETESGSITNSGNIEVTRASSNGVSGTQTFMKLTFKVLTTGSAEIQVRSGSFILRTSDSSQIWDETQNKALYELAETSLPEQEQETTPSTTNLDPSDDPVENGMLAEESIPSEVKTQKSDAPAKELDESSQTGVSAGVVILYIIGVSFLCLVVIYIFIRKRSSIRKSLNNDYSTNQIIHASKESHNDQTYSLNQTADQSQQYLSKPNQGSPNVIEPQVTNAELEAGDNDDTTQRA